MFHPDILKTFEFLLHQRQQNPIDAASDAAEFHRVRYVQFARFLITINHPYRSEK